MCLQNSFPVGKKIYLWVLPHDTIFSQLQLLAVAARKLGPGSTDATGMARHAESLSGLQTSAPPCALRCLLWARLRAGAHHSQSPWQKQGRSTVRQACPKPVLLPVARAISKGLQRQSAQIWYSLAVSLAVVQWGITERESNLYTTSAFLEE